MTFVHCGQGAMDPGYLHAWIDGCLCYLLTNASPGSSDGMMPGFLVEEGRDIEKLVIVVISLNLLTEESVGWMDRNSNDGWFMFTC